MATPQSIDPRARIAGVQEDIDRNRRLIEDSRRHRLRLEAQLRETGQMLERHRRRRGLLDWVRRR